MVSRTVQEVDESRGREAKDVQYSSGSSGRAKRDKHGGWRRTQETVRKPEYSGSDGGYKGVAREKTVTTAAAQKTKKYEINRGRRNYVREQTSASKEPVPRRYSYSEKKESLEVPDEKQVPNRVVSEEGEAEVEERKYFVGSVQDDKNASVNTELPDSKRTSWLKMCIRDRVSGHGSNTACKAGAFRGHSCFEYWCIIVSICALCFCMCCYVLSMLS